MLRNILLASVILASAAGLAQAQDAPRLVGGAAGGGAMVEYGGAPAGAFVGQAESRMIAGGAERSFVYGQTRGVPAQIGQLVGGGDDAQVVYETPAHGNALAATRIGAPRG